MKRSYIIIIAIVTGVGILWFISQTFFSNKSPQVMIETTELSIGKIEHVVTATGTIEPTKKVEVGTQISGIVEKIYVDFNSQVKKGQLIAELEKTNLQSSLLYAQSNYNSAINELSYIESSYHRQKALYEKQLVSKADFDEILYKYLNAKNTVEQRKVDVDKAKTNLSYASIISPIHGVVLSRSVDVGQTVAASFNTPTLFTIAHDLTQMQVEANVDEADIGKIQIGQRVEFTVDAFRNQSFAGNVSQIRLNPTVVSNVVTYTVIIDAPNPNLILMPGLTAIVSIYTLEIPKTKRIPHKALNFSPSEELIQKYYDQKQISRNEVTIPKRPFVWILNNDRLEVRSVELGEQDEIHVEIKKGIEENEAIVVSIKEIQATKKQNASTNTSPFVPQPGRRNR